jgi:DNA-binding winged helix-turn-helix (wHTH) protein/TolB-like protein/Flp pilus assembly protein TadD
MAALRFASFTLDVSAGVLMRAGRPVLLRPQPLKVLAYLAERSGQLVTNKELIESCWDNPRQTSGNSLTQCIKAIREALGETDQDIVRTVHGRGYLFAAPVSHVVAEPETALPAETDRLPSAAPLASSPPSFPPPTPTGGPAPAQAGAGTAPAARGPAAPLEGAGRLAVLRETWPALAVAALLVAAVLAGGGWAVWRWAARAVPLTMAAVPSIAVLPIEAAGGEEPERREAAALTKDVETELSRAPLGYSLRIRSAAGYKGSLDDPARAGRSLGVRYLMLGSTRLESGMRLVNVQLIEAESGRPVWAQPFSFRAAEAGAQGRAASHIARMLVAKVLGAEVALPLPAQPEAGHFAMLGRALMSGEGRIEGNRKAMAYFDKARALDPNSLPALLGYGRTRVNEVLNRWVPPPRYKALLGEAEGAIDHAARLAPFDAGVQVLRCAYLRAVNEHDEAVAHCRRAVDLRPTYPLAHGELGRALIETGHAEDAVARIEEAIHLSPDDPYVAAWYFWAGIAEAHTGRYDKAAERLLQARGAKRDYPNPLGWLAVAYAGLGDLEKGRSYLEQHRSHFRRFSIAGWRVAFPFTNGAVTEQRKRIEALLRRLGAPEMPPPDKVQTGLTE